MLISSAHKNALQIQWIWINAEKVTTADFSSVTKHLPPKKSSTGGPDAVQLGSKENWWHPQSFAASVPNNANKSQFIKMSWLNLDDRWQCVKQDSLNWGHSYVHPSMTRIFQSVKRMVTWADKKHGASSMHLDALGFLIGLYTYQRYGTSRMREPNGVKLYMWICFKQREGKIGAYDNPHFSSRPMKCDGSKHTTLQECDYSKVGAKPGQTP